MCIVLFYTVYLSAYVRKLFLLGILVLIKSLGKTRIK